MKRSVLSAVYSACLLSLLAIGCSYTKGGTVPTSPDVDVTTNVPDNGRLSARDAATLIGGWTGDESATVGESGTLKATFGSDGSVALTWTSATTSATATGTATGSLSALTISSSATKCGYTATGALSVDQNTITGTYQGAGPGICPTKKGSFKLTRDIKIVPPSCPTSFTYSGPNPFSLPNSGDATELSYVQTNVSNKLTSAGKTDLTEVTSWTSDGNYGVVLVKAADSYYLYTNVVAGQVLQSQSYNKNGKQQAISHVSRFRCIEGQ